MTLKRLRAFTLIELLIVITIIGILAVALVPRITGGPAKARDAARKADLQQIATALEFYADDNGGVYPGTAGTAECLSGTTTTYTALAGYMSSVPADPTNTNVIVSCTGSYYYLPTDSSSSADGYVLMANLENDDARGQGKGLYESGTPTDGVSDLTECTDTSVCVDGTDVIYAIGR